MQHAIEALLIVVANSVGYTSFRLFTLALTWIAAIAGLSAKTVEGASAIAYPIPFLPLISSAFVPTASMPKGVRGICRKTAGNADH